MRALQPSDPLWVGRYRLLGRLGSGGMGQVFLGQSPGGRLVAVKLIRADLAADPEFRARFAREVAAARHVSGMFTAAVVDADPAGPQPWLVTAYVPGPSLADAVAGRGPLPARSVLTLAAGLAEGLGAIHAEGMIHRDLKPSNVLLAGDGPRIIDFGISLAANATSLTGADLVVGSPGFMSPEQAQGQEVGPASDIFSLGAVLTFAATGEAPFGTGSATALLYRVVHDQPATGRLPGPLRPLVDGCLAKDPRRRPTTDQLLAGLGTAQPAAGWLPWPLSQEAASYAQPLPAPPVTGIPRPRPTAEPAGAPPLPPAIPPLAPPVGTPNGGPTPGQPGWRQTGPAGRWQAGSAGRRQARPAGRRQAGLAGSRQARPADWRPAASTGRRAGQQQQPGRPRQPPAGWGSAPGATNVMGSLAGAARHRSRLGLWAVAALVAILTGTVFTAVALTSRPSPAKPATPSLLVSAGPRAVVLAYFSAINSRNWHRVWGLGGKNLSPSYQGMVAGYRLTAHDDVTSIKVRGDTVYVHVLAHQSTGAVQNYRMRYVVHRGVITAGHATLLGTS